MMNTQNQLNQMKGGGGCCCSGKATTSSIERNEGVSASETLTSQQLRIQGISCGGCVKTIEKAIFTVPGVVEAAVDIATGFATVLGDVNSGSVIEAIKQKGYEAEVIAE